MATMSISQAKDRAVPNTAAGPVRKKLKTSDLPISSATRGVIDSLALAFKKKGKYDDLRQAAWKALEESVSSLPTQCHRKVGC